MARHEQPREDILREATALMERIEFELPNSVAPIIVGFRRDGSPSFFFGTDFVVQFNSSGELRRAYWSGRLVKAERGQLFFMDRVRSETEVILKTTVFSEQETNEFLKLVEQRFQSLMTAIQGGQIKVLRQIPSADDLAPRVLTWLESRDGVITVAQKPNAG